MSSVERICHYADNLAAEPARIIEPRPSASFGATGHISFDKVVMAYRPGLPVVLKGISFEIKAGEKIGIIGRTGAGKSSIMSAIFRFVELTSGTISIDGKNIAEVGIHDLRDKISIIPQEAFLFSG